MNEQMLDKKKLKFLIMPTRFPQRHYMKDYQKAYACWKEVWFEAYEEMGVGSTLTSDNFTRQSHIAVIFYGSEVACVTTLNYLNLKSETDLDDSYFKVWPEISLRRLLKENERIITCCNLALNPKFRRGALGIKWKDFMFALLVQHVKHSEHDLMVAAVRLEKGMERAAYRTGACAIQKDLPYTIPGQRVDLVCWKHNINLKDHNPMIAGLVETVWNNSWMIIDPFNYEEGEKHVA
jgi:hypothetical protein